MAIAEERLGFGPGRAIGLAIGLVAVAALMMPATGQAQDGVDQELTRECGRTTLLLAASCDIEYTCPAISDGCSTNGRVDVDAALTGLVERSRGRGVRLGTFVGNVRSLPHVGVFGAEAARIPVEPGAGLLVRCTSQITVAVVLMDMDCSADITVTYKADVFIDGSTIVYRDWGGDQVNSPTLSYQGGLLQVDDAAVLDPGNGCTTVDADTVTCEPSGVTGYDVSLGASGGAEEQFFALSVSPGMVTGLAVGGEGPDQLTGGDTQDTLSGGHGVDAINGRANDDVIIPGVGDDPDTIDGGPGH